MKIWPKTGRPSFVAGPVATNDEHLCARSGIFASSSEREEAPPRERRGASSRRARLHVVEVDGGVHRHDVEEVDGASVDLRPRLRGAVGDPLHLEEVLLVELPEEDGVGHEAHLGPGARAVLRVLLDAELLRVGRRSPRRGACRTGSRARTAPPRRGRRSTPSRRSGTPGPCQRTVSIGTSSRTSVDLLERHVVEPGGAGRGAVQAEVEADAVLRRRRDEERLDLPERAASRRPPASGS